MKKFPDVIYVTITDDDAGPEDLLAWKTAHSAEVGRVATYRLVEEYEKREAVELRRKGTKQWAKVAD